MVEAMEDASAGFHVPMEVDMHVGKTRAEGK